MSPSLIEDEPRGQLDSYAAQVNGFLRCAVTLFLAHRHLGNFSIHAGAPAPHSGLSTGEEVVHENATPSNLPRSAVLLLKSHYAELIVLQDKPLAGEHVTHAGRSMR